MHPYAFIDQKRWLRRVLSRWRMRRRDDRPLPARGDLRLLTVVRNEMLRLPYFYAYYRALGIKRFLVVDNASDDGTLDYLLAQPDTHVWSTRETYTRQEAWVDALIRCYGRDQWTVIVDVDELLVLPPGPASLVDRLSRWQKLGVTAVRAVLVDMYPEGALKDAAYVRGEPFLPAAPLFESDSIHRIPFAYRKCRTSFPYRHAGGVRERVFGLTDVCLTKFPIVRFGRGFFVRQGTHAVEGAVVADEQVALLHFKYLSDFGPRVQVEAVRGEHWNGAVQYQAYAKKVGDDPNLRFRGPHSVRYEGAGQLVRMGLIQDAGPAG